MSVPLVALNGVTKTYSGITALDDVGFDIGRGEAVCLAGENGSGKSTLIKILAGVEKPDRGRIAFDGAQQSALNPRASAAAGIKVIFQDFSLFPNLSVAENIAFSAELGEGVTLFRKRHVRDIAARTLARIGVDMPLDAPVETLSVAHKQLVAICRALATDAKLIIMDEPTTALTEKEVRALLAIIRRLKADGVAVLFVSHKLAEVLEVCEKVVVLRNGRKVAEGMASEFDAAALTRHMTGRDVALRAPAALDASAPVLFEVASLSKAGAFDNVNFQLRRGEVLGISGLLGSGRTALAKALFGLVAPDSGTLTLGGLKVPLGDPLKAAAAGIGYVPEDRLTEGLFLLQSIGRNVAVGRVDAHSITGLLARAALWAESADWLNRLRVKASSIEAPVRSLSGGNQQRVVLARWLARGPQVLVLNGPSVGVDVGSKAEIHEIIADLSRQGLGVIVISDDLPELLSTCHRILVMRAGRITDDIPAGSTSETELAHRLAS
ncbi:MAG: sugar ABC transporter ATP-binding protein [Rhizobiaceae bacterium]|jgi:simple sugar transport system ATP-binding protein|nr:sugar ABC transporter ATP-binding protein [Rhizobiaceae bacterium]